MKSVTLTLILRGGTDVVSLEYSMYLCIQNMKNDE